jgi:predicted esterase
MERVQASPANGFHHDYFLLVPEQVRSNCFMVVATPTPKTSDDPADFLSAAERIATNAAPLFGRLGLPVLVPALPRPPLKVAKDHFIDVYYPALSRAAIETKEKQFARIDLQVLAMVDDARAKLQKARGVEVRRKVIFAGFSAAGHFASRMAVLHPERVLAVWAGGTGGHPIVPVRTLAGKALTYPVGIDDLPEITGHEFARKEFLGINVMFVQGGADANTSLPTDRNPSDSYTYEQAELVREVLGTDSIERLGKVKSIWENAGAKVAIRVHPDAGHQITPVIARELVEFIERCLAGEQ